MITFALPELVARVRTRFESEAVDVAVPVTLGWRAPTVQRETSHRIVWVPGDDSGWAFGSLGAPESPHVSLARPLARVDEVWTCYIEAEDVSAPDDELAQYMAARTLYDAWYRAVYLARIPHTIATQRWVVDRTVRYAGAAIRVTGTVSAVVPDAPSTIAPSDTGASVAVQKLGLTQTLTIPAPTP